MTVKYDWLITDDGQGGTYSLQIGIGREFADFNGTSLMSNTTLIVVQSIHNTATQVFGPEGTDVGVPCVGYSIDDAEHVFVFKISDPTKHIGETKLITSVEYGAAKESQAGPIIPNIQVEDGGMYSCGMTFPDSFQNEASRATDTTFIKVLHVEVQPPRHFSGPRGAATSVTCQISFPKSTVMAFTLPSSHGWFREENMKDGTVIHHDIDIFDQSVSQLLYFK